MDISREQFIEQYKVEYGKEPTELDIELYFALISLTPQKLADVKHFWEMHEKYGSETAWKMCTGKSKAEALKQIGQ